MDPRKHQNVPAGTVTDHEGQPRALKRDYDHAVIPALELDLSGIRQLAAILPQIEAGMVACAAEMAAEAAEDEDDLEDAAAQDGREFVDLAVMAAEQDIAMREIPDGQARTLAGTPVDPHAPARREAIDAVRRSQEATSW